MNTKIDVAKTIYFSYSANLHKEIEINTKQNSKATNLKFMINDTRVNFYVRKSERHIF